VDSGDAAPVIRLRPDVEWQHVDDEVVLLDLRSSAYLAVNDTGAVLWPMVAAGTTEPELVEELAARFPVEVDQAKADVTTFVARLRSLTLVEEG
jgi:hypothetical protein